MVFFLGGPGCQGDLSRPRIWAISWVNFRCPKKTEIAWGLDPFADVPGWDVYASLGCKVQVNEAI